jgi:cytochrome c oxidase cbb3-type subunit III
MRQAQFAGIFAILMAMPLAQGCTRDSRAEEAPRFVPQAPATSQAAPAGDLAARFVSHGDHIQPGGVKPYAGMRLVNPFEGNASAVSTGEKLFVGYNCIDCHGAGGGGAMGPSLADGRWHFGGSNAEVFESIYQGRPEGMPAWGSLISDEQIWMLVSYVRSLEKGKNVTTENFTGATVERTGH